MKQTKKKVSGLVTIVVILIVILLALVGFLLWQMQLFGNTNTPEPVQTEPAIQQEEPTQPTEPEVTEPVEEETEPVQAETKPFQENTKEELLREGGEITTPYITLYFDAALTDCLEVVHDTGTPYVLEFYAALEGKEEQRIFDIIFADGSAGNLGAIRTAAGEVSVSMVIYTFEPDDSWEAGEINTVMAMQDAANDLIQQLMVYQTKEKYAGPEISNEKPESNFVEYLAIETPYGALSYPSKWQAYLLTERTQKDTYWIEFFAQFEEQQPVALFTIIFGGDHGEQIGAIKDQDGQYVTVNVIMEELNLEGFEDGDVEILMEMQEAINLLLAQLPLE